jgi:hypothetical protein
MASICNDEQASCGVMSGHDRKTLSLSLARDFEEKLMTLETVLLGVLILLLVGAAIYSRTS